jgi:hypothetical protein
VSWLSVLEKLSISARLPFFVVFGAVPPATARKAGDFPHTLSSLSPSHERGCCSVSAADCFSVKTSCFPQLSILFPNLNTFVIGCFLLERFFLALPSNVKCEKRHLQL